MKAGRLSPRARQDLDEIWLHVAQDDVDAADRLIEQIWRTCSEIGLAPGAGRDRGDLLAGGRSIPVGNYLIFYRERAGWIEILRVVHGMRDLPRVLGDGA